MEFARKKKIKPEALTLKQDGNEVRRQMRCGNNSMMATTSSSFRISKSYIYIYIVTYQRMKHNADIGDMATFNINATSEFRSFALSRSLWLSLTLSLSLQHTQQYILILDGFYKYNKIIWKSVSESSPLGRLTQQKLRWISRNGMPHTTLYPRAAYIWCCMLCHVQDLRMIINATRLYIPIPGSKHRTSIWGSRTNAGVVWHRATHDVQVANDGSSFNYSRRMCGTGRSIILICNRMHTTHTAKLTVLFPFFFRSTATAHAAFLLFCSSFSLTIRN